MNRRPLWIIVIGAALLGVVLVALSGVLSATNGPGSSAAPSGSGAPAGSAPAPSAVVSGSPVAIVPGSPASSPGAAPTCVQTTGTVVVRATDPATGFPVKVEWITLGPTDDLFFTLSDVSPTIPTNPLGPAAMTLGLSYITGGDRFILTAGTAALAYDPGSGKVTGELATGYGKNASRAAPDAQPSKFEGTLTLPSGSTEGSLTGRITHAGRRDYDFRVAMIEKSVSVAIGPGCPSARPTDAP
jgi:hypothetical protein